MYALGFVTCLLIGSSVAYYPQREAVYNTGANELYPDLSYYQNSAQEPSQRLFWNSGSNSVGGTGLWATLTNKFPFLGNMFGRLEAPAQYGVPNQADVYAQYTPGNIVPVPQYYQEPQFYQQVPRRFGPFPSGGRDVGITDDAVIITPPFVPVNQPAPAPAPVPSPEPAPVQPGGYIYNKPYNRLELPQK